MLSKELNQQLTQVGPGTPMGDLLRRYWHPVAGTAELKENPVKKVRLMGEDLVLYRDRSGNLGLIDEPCPHRRVSLEYGIPEEEGLRCPYHGWVFNHEGRCLEQPAEPWDSTFKDRITTKAYRAEELGGLIFAYMGPEPAPLLPHYDLLVWEDVIRHVGVTMLPCNWVQCMENSLDPVHTENLHGRYMSYVWSRRGIESPPRIRRNTKIAFDVFEHGIIKRRVVEGGTEEDEGWRVGHPVIFPTVLRVVASGGIQFQFRVPVDDTHTWHVTYTVHRPGIPFPKQETIPFYQIPCLNENGKFINDFVISQDFLAWASQGPIAQRDKEHLGQTDVGVILFRELLRDQMERVQRGEEPMAVIRDPAKNQVIELPGEEFTQQERLGRKLATQFEGIRLQQMEGRYSPIVSMVREVFLEADDRAARGELVLTEREQPQYEVQPDYYRETVISPQ